MKPFGTAIVALGMMLGAHQGKAATVPFSGTIDSAVLSTGLGDFTPVFAKSTFTGVAGFNGSGNFFTTLTFSSFSSDGPGCNLPGSGCAVFSSGGSFTVTDDGSPGSSHTLSQAGSTVSFSVLNPPSSISGALDLSTLLGHVSTSIYVGQAFRADDPAFLNAELSVTGVPLPSAAPLFGAALVALGAAGYGAKRRRRATAA